MSYLVETRYPSHVYYHPHQNVYYTERSHYEIKPSTSIGVTYYTQPVYMVSPTMSPTQQPQQQQQPIYRDPYENRFDTSYCQCQHQQQQVQQQQYQQQIQQQQYQQQIQQEMIQQQQIQQQLHQQQIQQQIQQQQHQQHMIQQQQIQQQQYQQQHSSQLYNVNYQQYVPSVRYDPPLVYYQPQIRVQTQNHSPTMNSPETYAYHVQQISPPLVNIINQNYNNYGNQWVSNTVEDMGMNSVSHTKNLIGPAYSHISVGINRKNQRTFEQLSLPEVYDLIMNFRVNESDLVENGYPLFTPESPNIAVIQPTKYDKDKKSWIEKTERKRICCRCHKEFGLELDGSFPMEKAMCRYHNRGLIIQGKRQTFEKKHPCCGEEYNQSEGCKLSDVHVTNQQFVSELATFVHTPQPTGPNDPRSRTFYALDCEMVYTVSGAALARLSVVDFYGRPVLDVFVKPPHMVLDPNTEFSGLTMKDIENATDTLETCREKLFKLVNSQTILIGHSLESDFKAMRIVHHNVIDTSILYQSGKGIKLPLRCLAADHLKRFIQSDNDEADGHCSFEDAKVCIDLVRLKLKKIHV